MQLESNDHRVGLSNTDTANIHAHDITTNECIHPDTLQLPLRVTEQLTRHIIHLHDSGTGIGGNSIRCQGPLGMS